MKVKRLKEQEAAGRGAWREDGVFVFRPNAIPAQVQCGVVAAPPRRVSLADRLAELPTWPKGTGKGARSWGDLGATFLAYPQKSQRSLGPKHPGLALD